jgi:hypothetical protein
MNKWLGILIIVLYFSNSFICEIIYPIDNEQWFRLKYGILTVILCLALEYKPQDNFLEKIFNAIVLQNAYILIFENENTYSWNDLTFIVVLTAIQYLKYFQKEYIINLYNKFIK